MTADHAGIPRMTGRFSGTWKRTLGELAIVALGVLLALWADQAMQARQEVAKATGYLERLQEDIRADSRSLRFRRASPDPGVAAASSPRPGAARDEWRGFPKGEHRHIPIRVDRTRISGGPGPPRPQGN